MNKKRSRMIIPIFAALAVLLIFAPFLIPVNPLPGLKPYDQVGEAGRTYLEVDGIRLHYVEEGRGDQVVIFLHGFGSHLYSWSTVMPVLGENYRVVAYDRPGFGLSERPLVTGGDTENPYTLEEQVDQLVGMMDRLGIPQAVLVGNSAGANVALQMALSHPQRVKALVFVDAAISLQSHRGWDFLWPLLWTPQADHLGVLLARMLATRSEEFLHRAYADPLRISPEMRAYYALPLQVEGWDRGLWEFTRANRRHDLTGRLAGLALPVLVISGDTDWIVPAAQSIRLAEAVPGAELAIMKDCGHAPQEECPQEFLAAVEPFLSGLFSK